MRPAAQFRKRSAKPKWLQLSSRADRLSFFSVAKSPSSSATAKVTLSSIQSVTLGKSRVFAASPEGLRFPEGCCLAIHASSSESGVACETEQECANLRRLLQRVVEANAEGGKDAIPAAIGVDPAAQSAEAKRKSEARRSFSPLSGSPPTRGRSGTDMSPTSGDGGLSRTRSASMMESPSGQSRSFLKNFSRK